MNALFGYSSDSSLDSLSEDVYDHKDAQLRAHVNAQAAARLALAAAALLPDQTQQQQQRSQRAGKETAEKDKDDVQQQKRRTRHAFGGSNVVHPGQLQHQAQDDELTWPVQFELLIDAKPGCGGITWPAAVVLSNYLAALLAAPQPSSPYDPRLHDRVLELGAGTGVVGIVLAKLLLDQRRRHLHLHDGRAPDDEQQTSTARPSVIEVTDLASMVPLMQANSELNKVDSLVLARELAWGERLPPDLIDHDGDPERFEEGARKWRRRPSLILVADAVYLETLFPLLLATLLDLTTPDAEHQQQPPLVLFCYQKRRRADMRFFKMAKKHFVFEEVVEDPNKDTYKGKKPLYLYRMVRKSPAAALQR